MPSGEDDELELESLYGMEAEESEAGPSCAHLNEDMLNDEDPVADNTSTTRTYGSPLDRRTKRKLDWILLPFLAVLFLLNSLDKSNVGNAETAGFTHDAGLAPKDLNISMAFFFAFFVALQPVGAALGRKFGMARWVPACMSLWGLCTLLHVYIRRRWQLVLLRIAIASLESGFYPTAVSYLSLFYTRYEFAQRLGFFYGQTAVAGVLGGVISWAVFSRFEAPGIPPPVRQAYDSEGWKSWEVLFLIEGCMTMVIASIGFFWLPHSADTAWFFNTEEKRWAEQRIRLDRDDATCSKAFPRTSQNLVTSEEAELAEGEAHHPLLPNAQSVRGRVLAGPYTVVTADTGLSRHDIFSAIFNYKIWHILVVNILSAIPASAFGIFLPLVVKQLSPALNLSPSASNLLSAPPFACGALVLFVFTRWSDRSKQRLVPILWGLFLLLVGLVAVVLIPMSNYFFRYAALCVILSGSFIASPLTVVWLTNNTPEPGKRAILLGINGWGNLAGISLLFLFTPEDRRNGYVRSSIITLLCVLASFVGYVAFRTILVKENKQRDAITASWNEEEKEREELMGDVPIPLSSFARLSQSHILDAVTRGLRFEEGRRGDEKMTFRYSL